MITGRKKVIHHTCKCGKPTASPNCSRCRECQNAYNRANRKKHSELSPEQRKRANARAYANVYLKRATLKKEPCEICGSENVQMHHEDYNKPLKVVWLCKGCHLEHHGKSRLIQKHPPRIRLKKGNRKKTCSKCSVPVRDNQRYCNVCHAAYMRVSRLKKQNP